MQIPGIIPPLSNYDNGLNSAKEENYVPTHRGNKAAWGEKSELQGL